MESKDYVKITDNLPTVGKPVMTYNGETEFKNILTPNGWKYNLKYPITHWRYRAKKPPFEEVVEIREALQHEVS